jgi:hypothetical protein
MQRNALGVYQDVLILEKNTRASKIQNKISRQYKDGEYRCRVYVPSCGE